MEKPLKFMVVDDEADICEYVKEVIEKKGGIGFSTTDGREALEIWERERPDVNVIDIHMPYSSLDGLELLAKIREKDSDSVCVILTCMDDEETIRRAKALGANHYITKPIGLRELEEVLDNILNIVKHNKAEGE